MVLPYTIQQSEARAKLGVHPLGRIPHDLQAAAPRRSVRTKARNHGMPLRPHGRLGLSYVAGPVPQPLLRPRQRRRC